MTDGDGPNQQVAMAHREDTPLGGDEGSFQENKNGKKGNYR
jgi:hypothetical protein